MYYLYTYIVYHIITATSCNVNNYNNKLTVKSLTNKHDDVVVLGCVKFVISAINLLAKNNQKCI